jgi:hypothetical protein
MRHPLCLRCRAHRAGGRGRPGALGSSFRSARASRERLKGR